MPRKTPKRRKTITPALPETKSRRAGRPHPVGAPHNVAPKEPQRDRRYDRRPPKFPGRLGGR